MSTSEVATALARPQLTPTPRFDGFFSRREIKRLTTWSDATLWRRVKEGAFPTPLQISRNRIGWLPADVESWLLSLRYTSGNPIEGGTAEPLPPRDPNRRGRGRPKNLQSPTPLDGYAGL